MNTSGGTFYEGWVFKIILINVVIFIIQIFVGNHHITYSFQGYEKEGPSVMTFYLGLIPALVAEKGYIWQIFSYMFLHGTQSFTHLFFNMYALLIFGVPIEQEWGGKRFLYYYLFCGTFAGLVIFLINLINQGVGYIIPTIGASGAVFGLLLAFGLLFPDAELLLFFIMPIKAKFLVFLYGGLELYLELSGGPSPISHIGHLGGLVAGLVYFFILKKRSIEFKSKFLRAKNKKIGGKESSIVESRKKKMNINNIALQVEILKKLKETGYESLIDDEIQYIKYLEIMSEDFDEDVLCDEHDLDVSDNHCVECENFNACFLREVRKYH